MKAIYVRAYYNESISSKDNGYQVNLMFYYDGDDDYFDEEFITMSSESDAIMMADDINLNGYEIFKPIKTNTYES